jgi:hypothetical protein
MLPRVRHESRVPKQGLSFFDGIVQNRTFRFRYLRLSHEEYRKLTVYEAFEVNSLSVAASSQYRAILQDLDKVSTRQDRR